MAIRDLIPITRNRHNIPVLKDDLFDSFSSLRRDMERFFDDLVGDFGITRFRESAGNYIPTIDVTENDREVKISAELPGMDEKDIELSISDDVLTMKGEKKVEKEEKEGNYYRMERSYGSFSRNIPLPAEVDENKAEAEFRKGVLTIHLPKKPEAQAKRKKIEIKTK